MVLTSAPPAGTAPAAASASTRRRRPTLTSGRPYVRSDPGVRFRPHYFSYTEPSLEIDFQNALVKKMGKEWLEIAGCGMVHPQVFENVGYDPEVWSGWAFGFGVERIAMLRCGINDIRLFYENNVKFLRQF